MPETAEQKSDGNGGKRYALLAALVVVLAQAVFFIGWIWLEWNPPGVRIRVATAPVDPRDIFRGQYLELSYLFDDPNAYPGVDGKPAAPPDRGAEIYAALACDEAGGLHKPVAFATTPEEAKSLAERRGAAEPVVIQGRVRSPSRFDFGINRYFVPEGTPEPPRNETVVQLLVPANMRPRLVGLEVAGKLWQPRRIEPRN